MNGGKVQAIDDLEYPPGSEKRREYEQSLNDELSEIPQDENPEEPASNATLPENVWKGA